MNSGPELCDDCINYNTFCVYLFNRTWQMDYVPSQKYASTFYWRHSRPNEELRGFNRKLMFFKSVLNVSSVWFLSVIQLQDKLRLILKKLRARLYCASFYCFSHRKSRVIFCKITYIFLPSAMTNSLGWIFVCYFPNAEQWMSLKLMQQHWTVLKCACARISPP